MRTIKTILSCLIILFNCHFAFGSGWPIGKKKIQSVPYYSFYTAKSYRDKQHAKIPFSDNGKFSASTVKLATEYGLTNHLAVIVDLPIVFSQYINKTASLKNSGISEISLGLKWNVVANKTETRFLAAQLSALLPTYKNDAARQPFLGYSAFGSELRLIAAGSSARAYRTFYNIETAFRFYHSSLQSVRQFHLNATFGNYISRKDIICGELSGISSGGTNKNFNQNNLMANADYTFAKFSLQYGRKIAKGLWLYGGIFSDFYNKNTGIGKGYSLFAVVKL